MGDVEIRHLVQRSKKDYDTRKLSHDGYMLDMESKFSKNYKTTYKRYTNNKIDEINDFDDILNIHLGKEKTKTFLNNFYPYILFKIMLGNKLLPPQDIDISIAVPTINYPDFIKFKINLQTS